MNPALVLNSRLQSWLLFRKDIGPNRIISSCMCDSPRKKSFHCILLTMLHCSSAELNWGEFSRFEWQIYWACNEAGSDLTCRHIHSAIRLACNTGYHCQYLCCLCRCEIGCLEVCRYAQWFHGCGSCGWKYSFSAMALYSKQVRRLNQWNLP